MKEWVKVNGNWVDPTMVSFVGKIEVQACLGLHGKKSKTRFNYSFIFVVDGNTALVSLDNEDDIKIEQRNLLIALNIETKVANPLPPEMSMSVTPPVVVEENTTDVR